MSCVLEVCLESVESAIIAEKNGAHRVELCANLLEGGTTPSKGTIKQCKLAIKIPIMVMIRPRGGDFCYSDIEFNIMKDDILLCKEIGVAGVVFGILSPDGSIDKHRTAELVQLASPLDVTFHRAFDVSKDWQIALEDLIEIGGIKRVLTSGQDSSVLEGLDVLKSLCLQAKNRITILPGGGVTVRNLTKILDELPIKEIHMALPTQLASKMTHRNPNVYMGTSLTTPEYSITITDGLQVQQAVSKIG
ncbi:copper homeostasis protein cutC [Globomyces pollinis-pini]|nr:copper homeostasis protein cutC [Globomyces pollinis-pini]